MPSLVRVCIELIEVSMIAVSCFFQIDIINTTLFAFQSEYVQTARQSGVDTKKHQKKGIVLWQIYITNNKIIANTRLLLVNYRLPLRGKLTYTIVSATSSIIPYEIQRNDKKEKMKKKMTKKQQQQQQQQQQQ